MIWKTGGEFIVHYFQAISNIAHVIESEQSHSFSLTNYVSSHDKQEVSDAALSPC